MQACPGPFTLQNTVNLLRILIFKLEMKTLIVENEPIYLHIKFHNNVFIYILYIYFQLFWFFHIIIEFDLTLHIYGGRKSELHLY